MAAPQVHTVAAPAGGIFSIAYERDPFGWRDPEPVASDEGLLTGNRFDAPAGQYRTRYYGHDPYTCFVEKLAPLRRSPGIADRIASALDPDEEEDDGQLPDSAVPRDFLHRRTLAHITLSSHVRFIDVDHEATLQAAGVRLGDGFLARHGLARFDRAIPTHQSRLITRNFALALHELSTTRPEIVGLKYASAHGSGLACFAVWDSAEFAITEQDALPIDGTHPDLPRAAALFGLDAPAPEVASLPPGFPDLSI